MRHMRRILILFLCVLLLSTAVYAAGSARSVHSTAVVAADGSCSVSLTVTISLDEPAGGLQFPLPKGAEDIKMNGGSVRVAPGSFDNAVYADLSSLNGVVGDYPITFTYTIDSVLETIDKKLYMNLPLLCGFQYPVESMDFTVTLPGVVDGNPSFSSGYLGNSVESLLTWSVAGNMITGGTTGALKDQETLFLHMLVSEEMFPGQLLIPREGNPELIYMGICAGLALIYWILMMRCLPIVSQPRTTPPEGVTAGEIGSRLSSAGVDLTMMAFAWAQLGYLRIVPDKYGRVLLEKRMDMGNERTDLENRCFRALFARGNTVDSTGDFYARLCLKVAKTVSGAYEMYRRRAGNLQIFRVLACGVSVFSGICFAMNLTMNPTLQLILSVLLAVAGAITAWGIQNGMYRFHIRGKTSQYIAAGCIAAWLLLSLPTNQLWVGAAAVAAQMVAGLAAAYGGRRSSLGRLQASQILGLRRYLKHVSREELEKIMETNPDYFFDMLPYAIALGVDSAFARQFGNMPIAPCSYLQLRQERQRSAGEWAHLMRKTADKMDRRQRKMQLEKWMIIKPDMFRPVAMPSAPNRRRSSGSRRRPSGNGRRPGNQRPRRR